ncbi:MAG TPA: hypothetical protein DEA08_03850 [Planctomycetes bacterium]|nr:hypothetical protein [Planctomycetota bacterium]
MIQDQVEQERSGRERGGALILVLITLAVVAVLVEGIVASSRRETVSTTVTTDRVQAFYCAKAGVHAAAHDLGLNGSGDGHVSGNVSRTDYDRVVPGADAYDERARKAGSDGYPDFSDDAFFLAQPDGYYEARVSAVDADTKRVMAKAKWQREISLLEGVVTRQAAGFHPFKWAAFSDKGLEVVDSGGLFGLGFGGVDGYSSKASGKDYGAWEDLAKWQDTEVTNPLTGKPYKMLFVDKAGPIRSNEGIHIRGKHNGYLGDVTPGPGAKVTIDNPSKSYVTGSIDDAETPQHNPTPTWTLPDPSEVVNSHDKSTEVGGIPGYGGKLVRDDWTDWFKTPVVLEPKDGKSKFVFDSLHYENLNSLVVRGTAADTIEIYITGGEKQSDDPSVVFKNHASLFLEHGGSKKDGLPTVKIYNVGKMVVTKTMGFNAKPPKAIKDIEDLMKSVIFKPMGPPSNVQYYSNYVSDLSDPLDNGVQIDGSGLPPLKDTLAAAEWLKQNVLKAGSLTLKEVADITKVHAKAKLYATHDTKASLAVYAPESRIYTSGRVMGALVGKYVEVNEGSKISYDTDLSEISADAVEGSTYSVTVLRELR